MQEEMFLQNIAEKLGRQAPLTEVKRPNWKKTPQWDVIQTTEQRALIEQFEKECEVVLATCLRANKETVKDVLRGEIERLGGGPIVYEDNEHNETYALDELYGELRQKDIDVAPYGKLNEAEERTQLEKANIGITYATYALAETATVVLLHDEYNGRALSLLPTNYIALIPVSVLMPRLTNVMKEIRERELDGSLQTATISFISGPSNSADIESILVQGVHGPVRTTYILIED